MTSTRKTVSTNDAPAAIGPYSQAVRAGELLFTSGQIPLKPDGSLETGDIAAQTRQVLTNLRAVLEAGGSRLGRVVKCTCFLKDMNHFSRMNEVYAEFFPDAPPSPGAPSRLPGCPETCLSKLRRWRWLVSANSEREEPCTPRRPRKAARRRVAPAARRAP